MAVLHCALIQLSGPPTVVQDVRLGRDSSRVGPTIGTLVELQTNVAIDQFEVSQGHIPFAAMPHRSTSTILDIV